MTILTIDLPDNIAQQAKDAGLLAPEYLAQLLKDAVHRQAGQRLLNVAKHIHSMNIMPVNDEEIIAEVKAFRAERQARLAKANDASSS